MNEKLKPLINNLIVTLTTDKPVKDALNTINIVANSFLHEKLTDEDETYIKKHLCWSYPTETLDYIQLSIR